MLPGDADGLRRERGHEDVVALLAEHLLHQVADHRLVLDEQDGFTAAWSRGGAGRLLGRRWGPPAPGQVDLERRPATGLAVDPDPAVWSASTVRRPVMSRKLAATTSPSAENSTSKTRSAPAIGPTLGRATTDRSMADMPVSIAWTTGRDAVVQVERTDQLAQAPAHGRVAVEPGQRPVRVVGISQCEVGDAAAAVADASRRPERPRCRRPRGGGSRRSGRRRSRRRQAAVRSPAPDPERPSAGHLAQPRTSRPPPRVEGVEAYGCPAAPGTARAIWAHFRPGPATPSGS